MEHLCILGIVSVTSTFDSKRNELNSLWNVDDALSYNKGKYAEGVEFLFIHIQERGNPNKNSIGGFGIKCVC